MHKVIEDNLYEKLEIRKDDTRFSLTQERTTQLKTIVFNPRQAQEVEDFIHEYNGEYRRELQEKKLLENMGKLEG